MHRQVRKGMGTMRNIKEIIIHCSATRESANFHASDIDKWHKAKGWKGIGYHYVIDLDGTIEKGRPVNQVGAHCTNHNIYSIGICYIGGLANDGKTPKDTRTKAQKDSMLKLLIQLIMEYPNATIHGHNEFAAKACPCFDVQKEYYNINLKK